MMKIRTLSYLTALFVFGCASKQMTEAVSVPESTLGYEAMNDATIYDAFRAPCRREHCPRDKLNEELFDLLVKKGGDVNIRDQHTGHTPLMNTSSVEVVQALLKAGASVNAVDFEGKTALMYFADNNCFSAQEKQAYCSIERQENQLNEVDSCSAVCADLLIKAGADVNAVDENKRTALMHVRDADANAFRDFVDDTASFVDLLIKSGANVNAKDEEGKTPLMYVGNAKAASLLIKAGADINAKDNFGRTPLMHSLLSNTLSDGFYDLLKVLKEAGANITDTDACGNSVSTYLDARMGDLDYEERLEEELGYEILGIKPAKQVKELRGCPE